jgi:hypothetical protein
LSDILDGRPHDRFQFSSAIIDKEGQMDAQLQLIAYHPYILVG